MIAPGEFFTLQNMLLVVPVVAAGVTLMPLVYTGLIDAVMPWKEISEDHMPLRTWSEDERRQILVRRNEDRMASAREAWRRGSPTAVDMIGRRRSDYDALGIPFPEDNTTHSNDTNNSNNAKSL